MRIVTMGPEGSCHENATYKYLDYHKIKNYELVFFSDLLEGLELVHNKKADIMIQCSAHLSVHLVTEKYYNEVKVLDTFIYPTKEIVLLERKEISEPKTLGLAKPTEGYLGDIRYQKYIYESTKPVVGQKLLEGKYDAGITTKEFYTENRDKLRLRKNIGSVLTTWLVYGRGSTFKGDLLSVLPSGQLRDAIH